MNTNLKKEELTMLDKELIAQFKNDTSVVGVQDLIRKSLNAKYGVDEKIIALLSYEQARKDFNNLKQKRQAIKNRIRRAVLDVLRNE